MLDYILQNKEWLFSGIGIAIASWLFTKHKPTTKMKQKSGKNSTNIQVAGNLELKEENKHHGSK